MELMHAVVIEGEQILNHLFAILILSAHVAS